MVMNCLIHYKGYSTRVEYSAEDLIYFGSILGIKDVVCFHSEKAQDFEAEFHRAVDDYLDFCKEIGKEPDQASVPA